MHSRITRCLGESYSCAARGHAKIRVTTFLENLEIREKSRNQKLITEKSGKIDKVREKSGNGQGIEKE